MLCKITRTPLSIVSSEVDSDVYITVQCSGVELTPHCPMGEVFESKSPIRAVKDELLQWKQSLVVARWAPTASSP